MRALSLTRLLLTAALRCVGPACTRAVRAEQCSVGGLVCEWTSGKLAAASSQSHTQVAPHCVGSTNAALPYSLVKRSLLLRGGL